MHGKILYNVYAYMSLNTQVYFSWSYVTWYLFARFY